MTIWTINDADMRQLRSNQLEKNDKYAIARLRCFL